MENRSYYIFAPDELSALKALLEHLLQSGQKNGNYIETLSTLLSIQFSPKTWTEFCCFQGHFLKIGGELAEIGWRRATRVYTDTIDRPTKPSYLRRLICYSDKLKRNDNRQDLDQLEKVSDQLAKKPGYSNLSFVILRPADLHDQFRPGYVPCVIAGDFKFRNGFLDLNVMFRTNDAFSVGYADIYYLRNIQLDILARAQAKTQDTRLLKGKIGQLNLFFARSYIERTHRINSNENATKKIIQVEALGRTLVKEIDLFRHEKKVT